MKNSADCLYRILKEVLIYSILSFTRRRDPSQIKMLDLRLRGDDE